MTIAPIVSVIVPTFNNQRTIGATIESILAQTFTDFELIIVDDGSTDKTSEIVTAFRDARIRYIYQDHSERSVARNTGIAQSRGEYLAFLDADDLWLPGKTESQVELLEKDSNLGLVYCDLYYFDDETGNNLRLFSQLMHLYEGKIKLSLLVKNNFIQSPTPLVRRSVFDTVGCFDPELPPVEDWDMWLRIANRFPISFVKQPLARYRAHKQMTSIRNPTEMLYFNVIRLLNKVFSYAEDSLELRRMVGVKKALAHYDYGLSMMKKGDFTEAQISFSNSIAVYPIIPAVYFKALQVFLLKRFFLLD